MNNKKEVLSMSLDAIRNISDAEEAVERTKAEAISQAKKALSDAEKAGEKLVADAIARGESESVQLIKNVEKQAAVKAAEVASNTENKKAAMMAHAESRMDEAAAFIIERIVTD